MPVSSINKAITNNGKLTITDNTEEKNVQYLLEGSISTLRKQVGIRNDFRGEVAAADRENVIRQLAETALRDPCMLTNPMMPERKDIEEIYDRIL